MASVRLSPFGRSVVFICRRWQQSLVDQFFNCAQGGSLFFCAERDRDSRGAGSSRSADSMNIILRLDRHVVVDDVADSGNVDSARRDIGSDKNIDASSSKQIQRFLAMILALVPVDGFCGDTEPIEFFR